MATCSLEEVTVNPEVPLQQDSGGTWSSWQSGGEGGPGEGMVGIQVCHHSPQDPLWDHSLLEGTQRR